MTLKKTLVIDEILCYTSTLTQLKKIKNNILQLLLSMLPYPSVCYVT